MSAGPLCAYCDKSVDLSSDRTYSFVKGWEKPRSAGGANQIQMRTSLGKYAHENCVELAKKGRLGQERLV